MFVGLDEMLEIAQKKKCAIPAFNVYNMETVMGVLRASDASGSPVIMQIYNRLFDSGNAMFLAPVILKAAAVAKNPIAFHLDHGASYVQVEKALRYGASSIMIDGSSYQLEENIARTKTIVELCASVGVSVEGELGHVGSVNDDTMNAFTDPEAAARFVAETGVKALAIMVGTAHGRYKKAPKIDIERIAKIRSVTGIWLVLHGGSGIPDEQIRASIEAGIRKINFGTDLCYAFMDEVRRVPENMVAPDAVMEKPIEAVKNYALEKIKLLGA